MGVLKETLGILIITADDKVGKGSNIELEIGEHVNR